MRLILLLVSLIGCFAGIAQKGYRLQYMGVDSPIHAVKLNASFGSRQAAEKYVATLPAQFAARGYASASVDSVEWDSTSARVWIFLGRQYGWGTLSIPPAQVPAWRAAGQEPPKPGDRFVAADVTQWQNSLLDHFANKGFPFAWVVLDSFEVQENKVSGSLVVQSGPPYTIDSIRQLGKLKMKPAVLYRYLQMKKGMPWSQHTINQAGPRLDEWVFANQTQPPQPDMLGSGATLNLYLDPRPSNIISLLLGFMPANAQTPDNKLLVTGDANLLLRNAFGAAESIGVVWQQIQYKSPRLNLSYQQPFLFGSQAGADFWFELFRKDTQFLNLNLRLGIPYALSAKSTGKVMFLHNQTNVSSVDTMEVIRTRSLPEIADMGVSNLGLEYAYNSTDYRRNPTRGWDVLATWLTGIKKIDKSNTIVSLKDPTEPAFNFGALYDTVATTTYQLRLKVQASKYIPVAARQVLKVAAQGGWLQSGNYYRNELFQIGGFRLLRGFDEESIFARGYAVGTVEYRMLAGKNGYFFAFADGGWAQYKDEALQQSKGYVGTGLGMALEAKNSTINISWAIGKQSDQPLDMRQSKIHLGVINYF
jgi:outer membrane protein assembly factor BamA